MVAIALSILSGGACFFLGYAFVRFNQEQRRLRPVRSLSSSAVFCRIERKDSAGLPSRLVAEDATQWEMRARRDALATGFLGFLALAAPFIAIRLLSSSVFHR